MRAQVPHMGLFPHRLRVKFCPHIRLPVRPSMDHPLVHPSQSGTRWLPRDSILISQYHQGNRPCTVISSHELGHSCGPAFVLLYPALDALFTHCRAGCGFVLISICARFTTRDYVCTLYVMYFLSYSRHSSDIDYFDYSLLSNLKRNTRCEEGSARIGCPCGVSPHRSLSVKTISPLCLTRTTVERRVP